MSPEKIEWLARGLTAWAAGGAVIAAVIGAMALWFSTKSGKFKDDAAAKSAREFGLALATAEKEIATAKEQQAKAEIRLEELRKAREPRSLNIDEFASKIKGKSKPPSIEIVFQPNDGEAAQFAMEIWMALIAAGWRENIVDFDHLPKSIADDKLPNKLTDKSLLALMPATARVGGKPSGVTLVSKVEGDTGGEILHLLEAFTTSGYAPNIGVSLGLDSSLPAGGVRVVVGPKP